MTKKLLLLCLCLTAFSFAQDYMGLHLGSTWTYTDSMTVQMKDTVRVNGHLLFHAQQNAGTEVVDSWFESAGDSIKLYVDGGKTLAGVSMVLPPKVGLNWIGPDKTGKLEVLRFEDVTTPAGVFKGCAVVGFKRGEMWYHPTTGLVKLLTKSGYKLELIRFDSK